MEQLETEVYPGDTGYVIIKQMNVMDDDDVISIAPQNIDAIIEALKAAKEKAIQFRQEWIAEGDDEPA